MTIARAQSPTVALVRESASLQLRRVVLWGLLAAKTLAIWGLQWDIQWHIRIGRDSFWIPPHLMMYAGVAIVVLLSFGTLARDTWRRRGARAAEGEMAVIGFVSTPGIHLAAWGIALTVLAAPIDDLWHRVFGIDVTLWSPPHLLGLCGSFINTAACLLIAHEVYPAGSRVKAAAVILGAALLLFGFTLTAQQAFHVAYVHGGLAFHLYAILGTLVFPLPYLLAANHTGLRSAPLLVFLVSMAISLTGVEIARVGFETVQPVAISQVEIAKDPTSPIAIAQAIRQKAGPPRSRLFTPLMSLVPVLVMVALDPRRRPVTATLAYGIALLATMTWTLSRSPAFAPLTPGAGVTLIAVALTVLTALAAAAARRLSNAFASSPDPLSPRVQPPGRPRTQSPPD
jgi:hypothetical protein